jgi:RNA polymerase sigma-70 factor (ECF subfamily)
MAQTKQLTASARIKLITLLPRLRRFATVLAGDLEGGDALLRAACKGMLGLGHKFQHGTAFDIWAFGKLHGEWLTWLRSHETPISQSQADASAFAPAANNEGDGYSGEITDIIAKLPPQQRNAVLLVYGEGFSYDEAAKILDTPVKTVLARVSRALASFIERAHWLESPGLYGAEVEQLDHSNRQAS